MKFKAYLIWLFLPFVVLPQTAGLIFNEIMFYPSASNSEFIEIYNNSSASADLNGYNIVYSTSNPDSIIGTGSGTIIPPGGFAVIFENDYDIQTGIYHEAIPDNALILKINSNAFGSNGMANTSDRDVYLIDPQGNISRHYTYSADNTAGISDEKIDYNLPDQSGNWGNSGIINGTPGYKNSVVPYTNDLKLLSAEVTPPVVMAGEPISVNTTVINNGTIHAPMFTLKVFADINGDSLFTNNELTASHAAGNLQSGDSVSAGINFSLADTGNFRLKIVADYPPDEAPDDNFLYAFIFVYEETTQFGDVVINEIKYAPLPDEPEWIELLNISGNSINLKEFIIADRTSSRIISEEDYFLEPNNYAVLSDNEDILNFYDIPESQLVVLSLPSLNNNGDLLKLSTIHGMYVDSVTYKPEWGGNNRYSLEKINPVFSSSDSLNWGECNISLSGTPGFINSLSPKETDPAIILFYPEKDFYLTGETAELLCTVTNYGYLPAGQSVLKIYTDKNNDSLFTENELVADTTFLNILQGEEYSFNPIITFPVAGNYYCGAFLESENDEFVYNNLLTTSLQIVDVTFNPGDIVINEIMYAPENETEWIELYNNSNQIINFQSFSFADSKDTLLIESPPFNFLPGEYVLFSKEDIAPFYKHHPITNITPVPTLNNSGDAVYLLDSLNRVIDSVIYNPETGTGRGISLEKINSWKYPFNPDNFGMSFCPEGGTPGLLNSVSPKEYDLSIENPVINKPYYIVNEVPKLSFVLKNRGTKQSLPAEIVFKHGQNVFNIIEAGVINPGDSVIIRENLNNLLPGINNFTFTCETQQDQYTWNDTLKLEITPVIISTNYNDIIINEINHSPSDDKPEWIEIFNRSGKHVNLNNFNISDSRDTVTAVKEDLFIEPENYLVFVSDSSYFDYYPDTSGVYVTKLPTLNNNGDIIVLRDSLFRIIDSLDYTGFVSSYGIPVERVLPEENSADSTNWKLSLAGSQGTPGRVNSVSPKDYDLEISGVTFTPEKPVPGNAISLSVTVKNNGIYPASSRYYIYMNNSQVLPFQNITIPPKDSLQILTNSVVILPARSAAFKLFLAGHIDEFTLNDTLCFNISAGLPERSLVINEVYPVPDSSGTEWIELYNNSDESINLSKLTISDLSGRKCVIDSAGIITPGEYIVLSNDSAKTCNVFPEFNFRHITAAIPSLNNNEDVIYLADSTGNIIDSLLYTETTPRRSVERIYTALPGGSQNNTGINNYIQRATPGEINSLSPKSYDIELNSLFTVPENPRTGDIISLFATIVNKGTQPAGSFDFITDINDYETTVNFSGIILPEDTINVKLISDLLIDKKINIKCAVVNLTDESFRNNNNEISITPAAELNSVIISEIYPAPLPGENEWIELYNNSPESVNIKNWVLTDSGKTATHGISTTDLVIQPDSYLIICSDTTLFEPNDNILFTEYNFGTLNNSGDAVTLLDSAGVTVNHAEYSNSVPGYSFELTDTDSGKTFLLSASPLHSTPGRKNYNDKYVNPAPGTIVINEVLYQPANGNPEFIELFNNGNESINLNCFSLIPGNNDFTFTGGNYSIEPSGYFVIYSDSVAPQGENNISLKGLTLSDNGNLISVKSLTGNTIDTLLYTPTLHNRFIHNTRGISLERISPVNPATEGNWSSCADISGSTPGKANSLFTVTTDIAHGVQLDPNPFSPDADGFEDFTRINYSLNSDASVIRIKIFDDKGRLIRTLAEHHPAGKTGTILFDGKDDAGTSLRIGIYIVYFEAVDAFSNTLEVYKIPVVSARRF